RIGKSGLPSSKVVVFGAQNSEGIAQLMRNANVFVLASHVENQPCVILEALCSGLPVVSTAAGGIHEEISDLNGLLVPTGDMDQLSNALYEVYTNYASYNRQSIAQTAAQNYSYEAVAEKLNTIYLNVLNADA
ncbi:MAG TPA: hypothetical protein DIU20_09815, partial [Cryomorphaceae bacterium]|nr:hypothetical protein [Cryomorphaceae bacterium]